ncbi:heterokaryon incompatibility protein-domain-containing protein [Stachybotrys elegans]|uniref:Heterokaryon incompatibility protein-domain-containing protein n=1 Tax=Stachybotrys elegans TaxID=80388 RepID=A0A8K0STZ7_9HYPO|nr:heterokaryon incompatibility protein-domain-containing protein [Stachybotrys elegans]
MPVPWATAAQSEKPTPISGYTGSEMAFATLRKWIDTCDRKHACRPQSSSLLPARVLCIRDTGRIFLHCTKPGETGSYACLSHCWGAYQPLRTTTANIASHQSAIHEDALPPVFLQAISVAARLHIPYLWIDSLCIIQDSESDWQMQSALMVDIYANSIITISAALATCDLDALFVRSPQYNQFIPLEAGASLGISARATLKHGTGTSLPLLSRAWVLQERLLSPRVVHFTWEELIWECMEQTTCECGCIRSLWSPNFVPFDKNLLFDKILRHDSKMESKERWYRLVEEYSRLQLTLDRDRLPAISGAARRLSEFTGYTYLAGLWKETLISDLLWERKSRFAIRQLDLIPSWSWAKLGCEVEFDRSMSMQELATVITASCDSSGHDAFGEVTGGRIQLSTVVQPPSAVIAGAKTNDENASFQIASDNYSDKDTGSLCARMAIRRQVYATESDDEDISSGI